MEGGGGGDAVPPTPPPSPLQTTMERKWWLVASPCSVCAFLGGSEEENWTCSACDQGGERLEKDLELELAFLQPFEMMHEDEAVDLEDSFLWRGIEQEAEDNPDGDVGSDTENLPPLYPVAVDIEGDTVTRGVYSKYERTLKITAWREKKRRRNFTKKVVNERKKGYAEERPRVGESSPPPPDTSMIRDIMPFFPCPTTGGRFVSSKKHEDRHTDSQSSHSYSARW